MSVTFTRSSTFTIAHARKLSSKVAADIHICAIYYGKPGEAMARNYAEEFAQLLTSGYVAQYEFGYERDGSRVVCWRYTVHADGSTTSDDTPGRLVATAGGHG